MSILLSHLKRLHLQIWSNVFILFYYLFAKMTETPILILAHIAVDAA